MPFDNTNDRDNSKSTFEITLSRILALIDINKEKNIPTFLMGDFNADTNRNNRFDIILKKFISENNLLLLDNINNTNYTHTFSTPLINGKKFFYNLDHFILYPSDSLGILINPKFNVFEDIGDTSDHNAINFSFKIETQHNLPTPSETFPPQMPNPNLDIPEILTYYKQKINENVAEAYNNMMILPHHDDQNYIDSLYHSTCSVFVISASQTLAFQNQIFPPINQSNNHQKNRKKWFTDELKDINVNIKYIYNQIKNISHPDPYLNLEYERLKKLFRSIQRRNIYMTELNETNTLDKISKEKNLLLKKQF